MIKFTSLFSIIGLFVPSMFTLIWVVFEKSIYSNLPVWNKLINLQLLVWPSSIFMMATASHKGIDFKMLSISIAVNIVLYSLVGFLIWWGLNRQRWVLYLVLGLIVLGWYKLLNL